MAESKIPSPLGRSVFFCNLKPARTPGPLGINDAADPDAWALRGNTPGPLGLNDYGDPTVVPGATAEELAAARVAPARGEGPAPDAEESADVLLLAAVAYGEASSKNVFEEMAAIAWVIVRQRDARDTTLSTLLGPKSTYAFAASDGNQRTAAFRKATPAERKTDAGMADAIKAARSALDGTDTDYSDGAYFWDGADIKTNYTNHAKVKQGIKFNDTSHNIYGIKESSVDKTTYWQVTGKDGKLTNGSKRGHYTYTYESTAAHGGTIFWKYGSDFIKATGNQQHK